MIFLIIGLLLLIFCGNTGKKVRNTMFVFAMNLVFYFGFPAFVFFLYYIKR